MSTKIIVSDLHLTANPLDEYRWGLFSFLCHNIRELPSGLTILFILGDLTVDKDRHSAVLVNRVVDSIVQLYRQCSPKLHEIVIVPGNHDGLSKFYFEFLKWFPYIKFVTRPVVEQFGLTKIALLPHTRTPNQDWSIVELGTASFIFMHQTVNGAVAESGHSLEGDADLDWLKTWKTARVVSGDVHVPQKIGQVEYVGAPYPIRFGDDFQGRVLVMTDKKDMEWHYPTIRKIKRTIRGMRGLMLLGFGLKKGDQVKFELELPREELHEFQKAKAGIMEWCEKQEVVVCGIELKGKPTLKLKSKQAKVLTSEDALESYVIKTELIGQVVETGRKLLQRSKTR